MSKVKIIARIRPFIGKESADNTIKCEGPVISLQDPRNAAQRFIYKGFSACYDTDSTQTQLFEAELAPLLETVLLGKTLAVLCYGVTSSGKTTTMQGTRDDPGIIQRAIEYLSNQCPNGTADRYKFDMQYFEVYCDDCYDLLGSRDRARKLKLRNDKNGCVTIVDLSTLSFSTVEEFTQIFSKASNLRTTSATTLNRSSSRSHAILNISVFRKRPLQDCAHLPLLLGKMEFVDLAGSERNKPAEVGPKQKLAESVSINKSLTALNRVIMALNSKSSVIPYRDSVLTRLLKNALGETSTTLLICNIAPGVKWLPHTRTTIEFASQAKSIKAVAPDPEEETARRAERLRNVDPEFNYAVEAEVARRLAEISRVAQSDTTSEHVNEPDPPMHSPTDTNNIDPVPVDLPTRIESPPPIIQEPVHLPIQSPEPQKTTESKQASYRRRLQKGIDAKKKKYPASDNPVNKVKLAKAYVIAGKMALDERNDIEVAVSMFEKAISLHPGNERLLEETLKLKKQLREKVQERQKQPLQPTGNTKRGRGTRNNKGKRTTEPETHHSEDEVEKSLHAEEIESIKPRTRPKARVKRVSSDGDEAEDWYQRKRVRV